MLTLRFAHPRFWLVWAGYAILWFVVRLPHPMRVGFGTLLGMLGYYLAGSRRRIVITNLSLCFPEQTTRAMRALARDTFRSGGISLVETAVAWLGRRRSVYDRTEIHGLEHLRDAAERGKGVILLGSHMATLDLAGAVLSREIAFDVMYRANKNEVVEWIMTSGRQRLYPHPIERNDIRRVIANLKAGHIVWYGPDQDYGVRNSVFVPFFGVPAATTTAVSRIARITGAPVIPFSHFRVAGGSRYRVEMLPPLEGFPSGSYEEDARRISGLVEASVRRYPEQYWWFHRRFKSRPAGEPRIY